MILGNEGKFRYVTCEGLDIPVLDLPEDFSKLRYNTGYPIGEYIYQYYGQLNGKTRKYKNIPGSILKFGGNYFVVNFDDASDDEKRRHTIADNVFLEDYSDVEPEDIFMQYVMNYKSNKNLVIGNESKLKNSGDVYIPVLKEEDDALSRIMKLMIIHMQIILSNYADKMDKEYSLDNLRSALNGATVNMTITKFLTWCEILGLEWEFTLEDNGTDKLNPLLNKITISSENPNLWADINEDSTLNLFQVPCVEGEDPLKRLIKVCIILKQMVLVDYKDKGSTPHLLNNMRSALKRSSKMMFPYFTYWCEILGVNFTLKIRNPKDGHEEVAGVHYRDNDYINLQPVKENRESYGIFDD